MRITTTLKGSEGLADRIIASLLPIGTPEMSLVDLGCGNAPRTRWITAASQTFVDTLKTAHSPTSTIQSDLFAFMRRPGSYFDLCFCLDVIEHFEKPMGYELLALIEERTRVMSVMFTPLGDMLINPSDPTGHKSGWLPEEFEQRGWGTIVLPRFHDPWLDGKTWGAFFAMRGGEISSVAAVISAEEKRQAQPQH